MIDNHVHSSFSADSDTDAEIVCNKAAAFGLDGVVFTDHLDYDYPDEDIFYIDFDKYSEYMDELKSRYEGKLRIFKGIEVGIQPHVLNESARVVRKYDFDYVIGSIHIIDGIDPYRGVYYEGKNAREAYGRYLREILFMVDNFADFDNAGHFEYITRYACYDDRSLRYFDHADLLDEILKKLIYKGKGFEINTGSFRDKPGITTIEFDSQLLKRYLELGGEIISLGSDAHQLEYLGYKFGYFTELLKQNGFKYLTHFEKRKPVFEKI